MILAVKALAAVWPSSIGLILRDVLSAPLMLLVYWQAGRFRSDPNLKFQEWLAARDFRAQEAWERLVVNQRTRARLRSCLELAYLSIYPAVPLGIAVLYGLQRREVADFYWTVVSLSAYVCYALVPFWQALPPWMAVPEDTAEAPEQGIRRLNVWILRRGGIGRTTFPSAHVAAITAASLVLFSVAPAVGLVYLVGAASIGLAAFVCRYHYAADTLFGAMLAAAVFLAGCLCFR